ncbi:MAG: hypothetical protein HOB40_11040 [Candidatus Marinimicrobia bacterium]|jgi:transcriptional regulator with XRE-family HTH domain|nr:hypothetical protein [Candidatus Neomarinimicrobiota bacterium]MBT3502551.1 hypothetical protein [Candidatus Neomarinimicrobiota bacterium]MBT3839588.1 hypothetical protein [Candidatus Neomarinimicrobiota bacterium]MBT3999115.1 hypothetical protein [Candidatus Neomarinimicrobiota bacterium]MBT4282310.1 hypothetical protein [Candidatus Neomarinimicrobiota bacterium]
MTRLEIAVDSLNNSRYTIQQWSGILGVTRDTIHKWLAGVNSPKRSAVNHIAEVIGKTAIFHSNNDVEFIDSGKPAPAIDLGKKNHAQTLGQSSLVEELVAQVQYLRKRVEELESQSE